MESHVFVRFIPKRRPRLGGDQGLSLGEETAPSHFLGAAITLLSLLSRFSPGKDPFNVRTAAGAGTT